MNYKEKQRQEIFDLIQRYNKEDVSAWGWDCADTILENIDLKGTENRVMYQNGYDEGYKKSQEDKYAH